MEEHCKFRRSVLSNIVNRRKRFSMSSRLVSSDKVTTTIMRHQIDNCPITTIRNIFSSYFNVDGNQYSKNTMSEMIITYYFEGVKTLDKRMDERNILTEEVDERNYGDPFKEIFFKFLISGQEFIVPKEIIHHIFSFLEYDINTMISIGSLNKNFYLTFLSSFPHLSIRKKNLYDISLVALRTTREIIFEDLSFVTGEMRYIFENIRLNTSLKVIDFSNFDSFVKILFKFTGLCSKQKKGEEVSVLHSFANIRTIRFTDKCKAKHLKILKKYEKDFIRKFKSTFPSLTNIQNLPLPKLLGVYQRQIKSVSFSLVGNYHHRGFSVQEFSESLKGHDRYLKKLSFSFRVVDPNSYVSVKVIDDDDGKDQNSVIREIHTVSKCVESLPSLETLVIKMRFYDSRNAKVNFSFLNPQSLKNLRHLEIYFPRKVNFLDHHFIPFEIMDGLVSLKYSNNFENSSDQSFFNPIEKSVNSLTTEKYNERRIEIGGFDPSQCNNFDFRRLGVITSRYRTFKITSSKLGYDKKKKFSHSKDVVVEGFILQKRGRDLKLKMCPKDYHSRMVGRGDGKDNENDDGVLLDTLLLFLEEEVLKKRKYNYVDVFILQQLDGKVDPKPFMTRGKFFPEIIMLFRNWDCEEISFEKWIFRRPSTN